jgi:hypothetical protein
MELVKALAGLTPADFTILIAMIPGAAGQVSRTGTVPEQAGELIRWAESATGPGLKAIEAAPCALRDGSSPSSSIRPNNLPFSSLGTLFKGRRQFLVELQKELEGKRRKPVVVHGLGGVGKTRAVLEYAWEHEAQHTALLFVTAASAAGLQTSLAKLVETLRIRTSETAEEKLVNEVRYWLTGHPGWLMIVDNVDCESAAAGVERVLPWLKAGQVVITSRVSNWSGQVTRLPLLELARDDAVSFLLERTKDRPRTDDDSRTAAQIAEKLDGLALALEQASAYISTRHLSFAEYLEEWKVRKPEALRWHNPRLMQARESVARTWETTYAQLTETEQRLLQILAWLGPEPIPLFLCGEAPTPVNMQT